VQVAALLLVPAGHTVQGVQAAALAADQLTPAVQVEHTAFVVAVQVEDRKRPATQTLEAHAAQGAKPVADQVKPLEQGAFATHASAAASHTKAGALQLHPVWPESVLLVLYPSVVAHVRHLASPGSEYVCAGHALQTMLAEAEQVEEPS
jgi:hypothetical protein